VPRCFYEVVEGGLRFSNIHAPLTQSARNSNYVARTSTKNELCVAAQSQVLDFLKVEWQKLAISLYLQGDISTWLLFVILIQTLMQLMSLLWKFSSRHKSNSLNRWGPENLSTSVNLPKADGTLGFNSVSPIQKLKLLFKNTSISYQCH